MFSINFLYLFIYSPRSQFLFFTADCGHTSFIDKKHAHQSTVVHIFGCYR